MSYELAYNLQTGKPFAVVRLGDGASIPLCEGNSDYQAFLKWNAEQKTPLDLKSTIPVVPPVPARDLAAEVTKLQARIAILEK
uniref:Uncharacterized protein n=1 Tax=viral metagenome TaxID=1070528 RepID=A0A6M3JNR5_9ZZZZ